MVRRLSVHTADHQLRQPRPDDVKGDPKFEECVRGSEKRRRSQIQQGTFYFTIALITVEPAIQRFLRESEAFAP